MTVIPWCNTFCIIFLIRHGGRTEKDWVQVQDTQPRGGSKNFSKGGLYTIVVTFNANGVEGK